nr:unnamed protein product [Digitaria exilis]
MARPSPWTRDLNWTLQGLPNVDLSKLDVPFTEEEILCAIKQSPQDKAPGPDGFTGLFFKKTKSSALLLKLDISKAFDSVRWDYLLTTLQRRGFPRRRSDYQPIIDKAAAKLSTWYGKNLTQAGRPDLPPVQVCDGNSPPLARGVSTNKANLDPCFCLDRSA